MTHHTTFNGILDLSEEYTDLEVIEAATDFLLTQGVQSKNSVSGCAYRGCDGLKCAVGAFIPDSYYDPLMESVMANGLCTAKLVDPNSPLGRFLTKHETVLNRLQHIHDFRDPDEWERCLSKFYHHTQCRQTQSELTYYKMSL